MENIIPFLFQIAILIMSVVVHEVAHGLTAYSLGDPTAKYEGRLTLNPVRHLDPFGSILVPALTYYAGGIIFGWAKPVPYNPYNLRDQRWGPALVAAAGPRSNLFLAIVFGIVIQVIGEPTTSSAAAVLQFSYMIVLVNVGLLIFNFVPIPPLDGSKVLFALLPYKWRHIQDILEQYGLFILVIFLVYFSSILGPIHRTLVSLLTGV